MKDITETPALVKKMEKDDGENITGMQLRIWKLRNGTEILMRLYKHSLSAPYLLWNGERTNGIVWEMMGNFLVELGIMKNRENWKYSAELASSLYKQDEFEDRKDCIYFAWRVCVPIDF